MILSGVSRTSERRYLNRFIRYISISFLISSYSFISLIFTVYLLNPRLGIFFFFDRLMGCSSSLLLGVGVRIPRTDDKPKSFPWLTVCFFSFSLGIVFCGLSRTSNPVQFHLVSWIASASIFQNLHCWYTWFTSFFKLNILVFNRLTKQRTEQQSKKNTGVWYWPLYSVL